METTLQAIIAEPNVCYPGAHRDVVVKSATSIGEAKLIALCAPKPRRL
jgi:hypothetical protein